MSEFHRFHSEPTAVPRGWAADEVEFSDHFPAQSHRTQGYGSDDLDDVLALRRRNRELRRALAESQQRYRELEQRLQHVLSEGTRDRHDLTPIEATRHSDIARDFQTLVEQNAQHLARLLPDSVVDRRQTHWVAKGIATICQVLFADTPVSLETMCRDLHLAEVTDVELVDDVHAQATALRKASAANSREHAWDFDACPGQPLDATYQQPWGNCDPQLPVWFVVAPAYLADGGLYCKQQVFTSWAAPGKRPTWRTRFQKSK